ncbi:MAG: alpha/beta hydrolase-fold protein [Verrucomicrobiota bacterium JB022]|nr:alpha/beta hydrolase-fold protein [Verrucomicrobiota bacterium JB022]
MTSLLPRLLALFALALPAALHSENTYSIQPLLDRKAPPPSPLIHDDRRVTFFFRAPQVDEVVLAWGEWKPEQHPMERSTDGLWSVTVGPVEPGLYGYNFIVDGLWVLDRANPTVKAGTVVYSSLVDVPGKPPRFDQRQNVPQGAVHIHHFYAPELDRMRGYRVYTPPGYDPAGEQRYPVLYLRHGMGDHEGNWTQEGRADVILDNLIAAGKAEPMIVVMPNGLLDGSWAGGSMPEGIEGLERELFRDIMLQVEQRYRVKTGPAHTAIAGLSMGGGQSFLIGLRHPERFGWVGDFSSGLLSAVEFKVEERIPGLYDRAEEVNKHYGLIYLACGTDDPRLEGHQELVAELRAHNIDVAYHETPGGHEWSVWREELRNLAQQLFKKSPTKKQ